MTTSIANMREQLLVNIKFLYGRDAEVLTISVDGLENPIQAIATTYSPFNQTLTKHLHGHRTYSYNTAIENLLWESEKELGKLLSTNGHTIPFAGDMLNQQSEFVFIPTPGSSLADDTAAETHTAKKGPADEHPFDDNGPREEKAEDEQPPLEALIANEPAQVPEEVVSVSDQQAQEDKMADVWAAWATGRKDKKQKKKKSVLWLDEPKLEEEQAAEVYTNQPAADIGAEQAPVEPQKEFCCKAYALDEATVPDLVPQSDPVQHVSEDDGWGSFIPSKKSKKNGKKTSQALDLPDPEPELEPVVEESGGWGSISAKKSKKGKKISEVLEEPAPESKSVVEEYKEWCSSLGKKSKKGKGTINVFEAPALEPELEPPPIPESDEWGSVSSKPAKKSKMKGKKMSKVVEEPASEPIPEPEPPIVEGTVDWGFSRTGKGKKSKKTVFDQDPMEVVEEPIPAPEPLICEELFEEPTPVPEPSICEEVFEDPIQPPELPSFEEAFEDPIQPPELPSFEEVFEDPIPELEPAAQEDCSGWGSFGTKKDKKKSKKVSSYIEDIIEERVPEPEPEPVVVEDSWAPRLKKDKKKKKGKSLYFDEPVVEQIIEPEPIPIPEAEPIPEPKPIPEDTFGWGFGSAKKWKRAQEEVTRPVDEPLPQPEPAFTFATSGASWATTWDFNNNDTAVPETVALASEEVQALPAHDSEAELVAKDEDTSPGLTPLVEEPSPPPAPAPRNGQTIVFTIRYPNATTKKYPLEVMLTLPSNTRSGIFDVVNAYLSSRDGPDSVLRERSLQIVSGVGRNGEVDLSALEEAMWPDYIEYFCRYTKLPELTIDVLDF